MGASTCKVCGYRTGVESSHPAGHAPDWERCTCGSGNHPRACELHPGAYAEHIAELDAENAE